MPNCGNETDRWHAHHAYTEMNETQVYTILHCRLYCTALKFGRVALWVTLKDMGGGDGGGIEVYLKGKVHLYVIEKYKTSPTSITTARKCT